MEPGFIFLEDQLPDPLFGSPIDLNGIALQFETHVYDYFPGISLLRIIWRMKLQLCLMFIGHLV